jgi:hypothetical protein
VPPGLSTVSLEAVNFSGAVVGTGSLAVNNTTTVTPASAANLVVSELMYHPADPGGAESDAGFTSSDQFEYLEVMNIGTSTINLTGVAFSAGIDYAFASGTTLPPGQRLVVARDRNAFLFRHPAAAGQLATGAFLNATGLNNAGETLRLLDATGGIIKEFAYDDGFPWPGEADGNGASLVLVAPASNPDHSVASHWRSSVGPGGSPGTGDAVPFSGNPNADADQDGLDAFTEHAIGTSDSLPNTGTSGNDAAGTHFSLGSDGYLSFSATRNLAADDVVYAAELSSDLTQWQANAMTLVSETPNGPGTTTLTWRSILPVTNRVFARLHLRAR